MVLCREDPRYGYRGAWALLRREGWAANKKRVHRSWKEGGLKVPDEQQKRRRLLLEGASENGRVGRGAEHKDHVRSYHFVMDRTPRAGGDRR
jgi:transposase InsO family protein